MSTKQPRHTPSPSPSSPPMPHHPASKLPKFLQKQSTRDRSKSMTDPAAGGSSTASLASVASGSSVSTLPDTPGTPSSKVRKSSKFLAINRDREKGDKDDKRRRSSDVRPPTEMEEPPVIIEPPEPVTIPRPRTRSERPLSADSQNLYASTSSSTSTSRIGDLPTRLSGWFSHTFSTSSTDLPSILSSSLSNSSPVSPKPKTASSALLTAAKHGKGHLDKAVRYLLDSDSTPDKCTDPIWLLGVQHPGYEPPPPVPLQPPSSSRRNSGSFRSSTSSTFRIEEIQLSQSQSGKHNPAANWPPDFYVDFTSRIWLTYRSQFTPIRDTRLADLESPDEGQTPTADKVGKGALIASPSTVKRPWNWGGEKGWTSDSGWGCMLRTGQSLLASALVHLHLGRDWRRPPQPVHTADYATYVQILTWFFDTPAPEAPFSVHRMALAGKELGKDVGQWFGPSTAAGAIKTLVGTFPDAGLGVAVATDGVLFQTEIFAASNSTGSVTRSPKRHAKLAWGDRPVLLLVGVRLGIDGVNPIYYDTIKLLYTFPQSVGIAGGRPSSSYYFVGSQADNLFYLDPHHARPAIPFRPPPSFPYPSVRETTPESDREGSRARTQRSPPPNSNHYRAPTSPSSVRTGSSTFSYHAPMSPSPLQQEFSTSTADGSSSSNNNHHPRSSRSPPPSGQHHSRWHSSSQPVSPSSEMDYRELTGFGAEGEGGGLDPVQEHYCTAYHTAELKTFHCERVRKMPLSGLDPSMLIGFLCKSEADFIDFRKRVGDLPRTVFSVQDEPPTWPSDSDDNMGLESISEPDDLNMDMEDEEDDDAEAEQFFDTRSGSPSTSSASASGGDHSKSERSKSEEVDTEEDPVDPITPGPNSRFSIGEPVALEKGSDDVEFGLDNEDERLEDDDIEDDWVDPLISSPGPSNPSSVASSTPIQTLRSSAPGPADVPTLVKGSSSNGGVKKRGKKGGQIPVPVPLVKLPEPSGRHPQEHFPFPVTQRPAEEASCHERTRTTSSSHNAATGKRMHTARARDGGRTQSGGVKGVLTDD